ncbi:MAG: DUF4394 domain-containing protein [Pseudomonadota bacterium]
MFGKICLATAALVAFAAPATARPAYAVNTAGALISFDTATPGVVTSSKPLVGLAPANVRGLDFRPATGQLYALGSDGIYQVNLTTGQATMVGPPNAFLQNGANFGFDFNPTVDRIRLVSDAEQNSRLSPDNGFTVATDSALSYAAGDPNAGVNPNVVAAAYTNNFVGSGVTTLYGIDSDLNLLVVQNPPNAGVLNSIGLGLGFDVGNDAGFDIFSIGGGNEAYLSSGTGFYSVDLTAGTASLIGNTGGFRGFAVGGPAVVADVPEPASWLMMILGFGLVGGVSRRARARTLARA